MSRFSLVLVLLPGLYLAACNDSNEVVQVIPTPSIVGAIQLLDDCDSASFNLALGAGTCIKAGGTTFDAFNAELNATTKVVAWRIEPAEMDFASGTILPVQNGGGETHTYTEVEEFGGGIVPALNQAAGLATMAPECALLTNSDFIASGQRVQHTFDDKGDEKYQCCIHPWMRQVVHVH